MLLQNCVVHSTELDSVQEGTGWDCVSCTGQDVSNGPHELLLPLKICSWLFWRKFRISLDLNRIVIGVNVREESS